LALKNIAKEMRKGFNSLAILVAWKIRKHRNECVFNGANPSASLVLQSVANESVICCSAGACALAKISVEFA